MGKPGGKRKIWYTQSTGFIGVGGDPAKEVKVQSGWQPGKSRNKFKTN